MYANALYSFEIAKLIHFTQIERGTSAMFVGTGKDPSLILRLQGAYDDTNDAIWRLSQWIPVTSQPKFASRDVYEQWIQNFRYEVFTMDKTIEEVLAFYTSANSDFIYWIINTLKVRTLKKIIYVRSIWGNIHEVLTSIIHDQIVVTYNDCS